MPELTHYAEAGPGQWRDPLVQIPPRHTKIHLLTKYGIALLGTWNDDGYYMAWMPLVKKPDWLTYRDGELRRKHEASDDTVGGTPS